MKHFKHLFLLMLIMMGLSPAIAQTQTHEEPYEVDFNTSISTSSGFSVAPGWQHLDHWQRCDVCLLNHLY